MTTAEQSGSPMDNTVVVHPESVKLIVNKHFHSISPVQRTLLAEGSCDSGVSMMLSQMIQEIIQKLSASTISVVLPMFQERFRRNDSQADIKTALENLSVRLGDSLPDAFAEVLDVPQEKCESAEKLTELVEMEVSLKVKSAVSLAISTHTLSKEPAIFVSSSVSSTASLCHMVTYLKSCVRKVTFGCRGCCSSPASAESTSPLLEQEERIISAPSLRCESAQSMKSKVSDPSVSRAVATILDKWSSETPETREEADAASSLPSPSADAQDAAADIVNIISRDLHYQDSEFSSSAEHHFNTGLIHDIVKDFVASRATPSEDKQEEERKCRFFKFVKRLFEKMKSELKTSIQKEEPDFIVPLSRDSDSSQPTNKEEDAEDFDLPGVVPESPRPSSAGIQAKTTVSMSVENKMPSSLDFEMTNDVVESLFKMLSLPKEPAAGANRSDVRVINMTKKFSKDLSDKLYDHFTATSTYRLPSAPMGRCLSDSVICNVRRKVDATQCSFSPEVMYAMTEDAVRKFLQQLLFWVEEEESNQTSHSEKVSGALCNIKDLITKLVTLTKSVTTTPCCSFLVEPLDDDEPSPSFYIDDDRENMKLRDHVDSLFLTKKTKALQLLEESPELLQESPELLEESTDTSSRVSEKTTNNIITTLLLRLTINAPEKSGQSSQTEDIDHIVQRLSDMARSNIHIDDFALKNTGNNMKRVNKAVIEDLKKEFGSAEQLLEAAAASNSSPFDEAVLKYLKIHLDALHGPRRTADASFFSRVGKALAKPFDWCTTDGV